MMIICAERGLTARRGACVVDRRRRALQQQERRAEDDAANGSGDAEAPPPSALVPQGSTLHLKTQCTRADTRVGEGFWETLEKRMQLVQTRNESGPFPELFSQVTAAIGARIHEKVQVKCRI